MEDKGLRDRAARELSPALDLVLRLEGEKQTGIRELSPVGHKGRDTWKEGAESAL